jgi:hypothetical protein
MDRSPATSPGLGVRRPVAPMLGRTAKEAAHGKRHRFLSSLLSLKPVSAARSRSASPRIPRPRLSGAVGSDSSRAQTGMRAGGTPCRPE